MKEFKLIKDKSFNELLKECTKEKLGKQSKPTVFYSSFAGYFNKHAK